MIPLLTTSHCTFALVLRPLLLSPFSPYPSRPQKVTAFSRPSPSSSSTDSTLLAIGSTNSQLSLLRYPELEEVWPSAWYGAGGEKGGKGGEGEGEEEVIDVDFNDASDLVRPPSFSQSSIVLTRKDEHSSSVPPPTNSASTPPLPLPISPALRNRFK